MSKETKKLKVLIFAGGSGTQSLTASFLKYPTLDINVVINAYDDGLSTGKLRELIPGMLGPSDVRKNVSRLMCDENNSNLKKVVDFRFNEELPWTDFLNLMNEFIDLQCSYEPLIEIYSGLSLEQAKKIAGLLKVFIQYIEEEVKNKADLNFYDFSFGNILLSSCFLNSRNFNSAVEEFCELCRPKGNVINVTNGDNLVLTGVKEDGSFLENEAQIVAPQSAVRVREIFILKDYLNADEVHVLDTKDLEGKVEYLRQKEVSPKINEKVKDLVSTADIIIYGPGTQHSSLFPSYLTEGLVELIQENKDSEKIFISNIIKDHEIQTETANSIIEKFFYYLSSKGKKEINKENLVKAIFVQIYKDENKSTHYLKFNSSDSSLHSNNLILKDWEELEGKHYGSKVLAEIIEIINHKLQEKLKPYNYMVSILVPVLDEEKTLLKVLNELRLLDFAPLSIGKEIIVIDGGSTDRSIEIANSIKDIKTFEIQAKGRGDAIRSGIDKATGNIIALFHADGEYNVNDLYKAVEAYISNDFDVVFGSRTIRCFSLSKVLKHVYGGDVIGYIISKYGGMLISTLNLLLLNRYISDPLTGIKVFKASLLKNLKLESSGLCIETEALAKLGKKRTFILEIPVDYYPRTRKEGKKTTFFSGMAAVLAIIKYCFVRCDEEDINNNSSL